MRSLQSNLYWVVPAPETMVARKMWSCITPRKWQTLASSSRLCVQSTQPVERTVIIKGVIISEGGRDLQTLSYFFLMFSTSVGPEWSLCRCPRSQKPAGVQKCPSYLLTSPGSPGRSNPGRGNSRNIEFWGNLPAHSHIFNNCNTLF